MPSDAVGNFPVNPESGDFWHSFTDISVSGYGPGLNLARTYNSLQAMATGIFGYGWTPSYPRSTVAVLRSIKIARNSVTGTSSAVPWSII
jgi:hypothetical protein